MAMVLLTAKISSTKSLLPSKANSEHQLIKLYTSVSRYSVYGFDMNETLTLCALSLFSGVFKSQVVSF